MDFLPDLIDWAWARHHNEWSWYIRPLIIIAFCAAAWFRRPVLLVALGLFFPLSAIVFPAPESPKPYVVAFLESERQMLEALSLFGLIGFAVLVVVFLGLLATALWRRSFWTGVLVANLGGVLKLIVSKLLWQDVGDAAILPTIVTALIFNAVALGFWWRFVKKNKQAISSKPLD